MPRGGSRPGAGRAKGAVNKETAAKIEAVKASGLEMPLDYMLRVMNDTSADHDRRADMAKAAAPYCHARLATVEHTGKDGGKILVELVQFSDGADEDQAPA